MGQPPVLEKHTVALPMLFSATTLLVTSVKTGFHVDKYCYLF